MSEMCVMYLFSTSSVVNPVLDFVNIRGVHICVWVRVCIHIMLTHAAVSTCVCIRYCVFCIPITLHTFDSHKNAVPKHMNMDTSIYYTYILA